MILLFLLSSCAYPDIDTVPDFKDVKLINNDDRNDFFKVQNTNNCFIKLFNHYDSSKIIIVSLIDNLLKGASGQAVQCMNIMFGYDEKLGLDNIKSD